jgi:hypothetical protein
VLDGCDWRGLHSIGRPASAGAAVAGVGPLPLHARRTSVRRHVAVQLRGRRTRGPDARGQRWRNGVGGRPLGLPSDAGQGRLRGELRRTSAGGSTRGVSGQTRPRAETVSRPGSPDPAEGTRLTTRGCRTPNVQLPGRGSRRSNPQAELTAPELIRGWPARFDGGATADRTDPTRRTPRRWPWAPS